MSLDIFWYLPTQGDERYLGTTRGQREPTFGYLTQVAQAVDNQIGRASCRERV